jgi:hypothetical protein
MLQVNISLTTLAAILWLGMLIISGSIWILASQVRKVADVLSGLDERALRLAGASGRRVGQRHDPVHSLPRIDVQARLDEVYARSN